MLRTACPVFLVLTTCSVWLLGPADLATAQEWNCVRCTDSQTCEAATYATGCECSIRVRGGITICRERGYCPEFCDPEPPPIGAQSALRLQYLDQLFEAEPLLAAVLFGSQVFDEEGRAWFDTESYPHGTLSLADGTPFTHSANFLPSLGEVRFRVELENGTTGEVTVFVGAVRERGRLISYHRISGDERTKHDWKARPAPE